jgi:hypothetical protein
MSVNAGCRQSARGVRSHDLPLRLRRAAPPSAATRISRRPAGAAPRRAGIPIAMAVATPGQRREKESGNGRDLGSVTPADSRPGDGLCHAKPAASARRATRWSGAGLE